MVTKRQLKSQRYIAKRDKKQNREDAVRDILLVTLDLIDNSLTKALENVKRSKRIAKQI